MQFRLRPWVSWSFFCKTPDDCCFAKKPMKPGVAV